MNENPERYSHDSVLIRETAARIIEDFSIFDISIIFSGNEQTAYHELAEQLLPVFSELIVKNRPKLMQILYKIDISEHKLKSMSQQFPEARLPEIISHLVIEREL